MRSRVALILAGALMAPTFAATAQTGPRDASLDPVVTVTDRKHLLPSALTGHVNALYVSLPASYGKDSLRKYPVVYVLDGQWDLRLITSIQGNLNYDGYTPEVIIVGVTYAGPDAKYDELRTADYTPVQDTTWGATRGTGGGPKFFSSLKTELIPLVEKTYRADPAKRVLVGSSFGGLFALYAMFTEPELFSAYVASSPSVSFGSGYSFKQDADYAGRRNDLPVRLFLSVGEMEGLARPVQAFMKQLSGRGYKKLELQTRVVSQERHASQKPESYTRALRFAFGGNALAMRLDSLSDMRNNVPPEVALPTSDVAKYVGTYEITLPNGKPGVLRVFADAGRLKIKPEGQPGEPAVLRYLGKDTFTIAEDPTLRITVLFENGRATKVRVLQEGNVMMGSRRS